MNSADASSALARARPCVDESPAIREKLSAATRKALDVLETLLDTGEPREQADAARILLASWVKLRETETPPVVVQQSTPEERRAAFRAMLRERPPELMAELEDAGIVTKGSK
jgi:hypothetical protein